MLYYLFNYLEQQYALAGASLFGFLSFRAALSVIFSLLLSTIFGKRIISFLQSKQVGESIRDLGLDGQKEKAGTPTMGGVMIILFTLIPVFLLAKLENIYIQLLIVTTLWMGTIGGLDDYIKIFKKDKDGLKGRFKVFGQIILGIFIGSVLYFHPGVTVRQEKHDQLQKSVAIEDIKDRFQPAIKSTLTTIPMLKDNEFNYASLLMDDHYKKWSWLLFIPIVVFIITAVSNGANLTDGIDGLAAGSSAIMVFALGVFAWVSGNLIFADYLNIMFIPKVGEVTIFVASFLGSLIGFLWYNTYPASIFMGDTGSLTIGALISVIAIMVRKELLLPILCGIFNRSTFGHPTGWIFQVQSKEMGRWKTDIFNVSFTSSFPKERIS